MDLLSLHLCTRQQEDLPVPLRTGAYTPMHAPSGRGGDCGCGFVQDSSPMACIDLVDTQVLPESPRDGSGRYMVHIKTKASSEQSSQLGALPPGTSPSPLALAP